MFKFFRKYQKVIILVGLPILLVIFLVPQAIEGIGQYSARQGRTVATYTGLDGRSYRISAAQHVDARLEHNVITRGLPFNILQAMLAMAGNVPYDQAIKVTRADHWLLLVEEAKQLQLIGGIDDARTMAASLGAQFVPEGQEPLSAEQVIAQLATNAQVPVPVVVNALRNLQGVQRLIQLYRDGVMEYSMPRVQIVAGEYLQGVDARVVVIPALATRDDLPEPTEEELLAHLQRFANDRPGEGDRGFGYRLPDQVKLEWIEIDPARVRDRLSQSDRMSRLELRRYWLQNRDRFLPSGVTDAGQVDFSDVENQVRATRLQELTSQMMDEMVRYAEGEIIRRTRELQRQAGYLILTDDWPERRVDLNELANDLQRDFNLGLPSYQRRANDWISVDVLTTLDGIGNATTDRFGPTVRFSDVVRRLKEFGGDPQGRIFAQEGVVGPVMDHNGRKYFFRVIDTRPSHPPTSIDDVRDQLTRDLKRLRDYERLIEQASEIEQRAIREGLESIAQSFESFAQMQQNISAIPPESQLAQFNRTQFMPPVGRHVEAAREIVDRANALIQRMLRDGIAFDELPIDARTFIVEVPDRLALMVVQIEDLRPLLRDEVAFLADFSRILLSERQLDVDPMKAFSYESMVQRFRYVGTEDAETLEDAFDDDFEDDDPDQSGPA